jgi:hypothetical protein
METAQGMHTCTGQRGKRGGEVSPLCGCGHVFLLAAYISYESLTGLMRCEEPLTSPGGDRPGRALPGRDAHADLRQATHRARHGQPCAGGGLPEAWVCSYLSLALLVGLGGFAIFGWWRADPIGALAKLHVVRTDRGAIQVLRRHCPEPARRFEATE